MILRKIVGRGGIFLFFLLVTLSPSQAAEEKPSPLEAEAAIGYVETSGNSSIKTGSLKSYIRYKAEKVKNNFDSYFLYGESDGKNNVQKIEMKNRLEGIYHPFFPFWDIDYYRNPFQKYEHRLATGPGLGFYFFKEKKRSLSASYYLYYAYDELIQEQNRHHTYWMHNVEERFKYKVSPHLSFKQKAIYRQTTRKKEDYFLDLEFALSNKINSRFAIDVSYLATFQNRPVSKEVKKWDSIFTTSLVVKF